MNKVTENFPPQKLDALSYKAYQFITETGLGLPMDDYYGMIIFDLTSSSYSFDFPSGHRRVDICHTMKNTHDLKLKALCGILLMESESFAVMQPPKDVEEVLNHLKTDPQDFPCSRPEDRIFYCIHALHLAHLLGRESEFSLWNQFLEQQVQRRFFQSFSKELDTHIFLYYFTQLISKFPYLSFQWKNELCRILEESTVDDTLTLSSKVLCKDLLDIKSENIRDYIRNRQDGRGCFPYEGRGHLTYGDVLSTAFAFSALNSQTT